MFANSSIQYSSDGRQNPVRTEWAAEEPRQTPFQIYLETTPGQPLPVLTADVDRGGSVIILALFIQLGGFGILLQ